MILEGKSDLELADANFGSWCSNRGAFQEYRRLAVKRVCRDVEVYVVWGMPGTGKTRLIYETHPDLWISNDPTLRWFDGYCSQSVVLLDDYRGDGAAAFLLRLLDRYPMDVPVKGGFVQWLPKKIFITSNIAPPFGHNDIAGPLRRRVKHVLHFTVKMFDQANAHHLTVFRDLIQ